MIKRLKDDKSREGIKRTFDRPVVGVRNVEAENNANNGKMGSRVLRKGRYYDSPDLFVKTR